MRAWEKEGWWKSHYRGSCAPYPDKRDGTGARGVRDNKIRETLEKTRPGQPGLVAKRDPCQQGKGMLERGERTREKMRQPEDCKLRHSWTLPQPATKVAEQGQGEHGHATEGWQGPRLS